LKLWHEFWGNCSIKPGIGGNRSITGESALGVGGEVATRGSAKPAFAGSIHARPSNSYSPFNKVARDKPNFFSVLSASLANLSSWTFLLTFATNSALARR
jgi:hypothetical protein